MTLIELMIALMLGAIMIVIFALQIYTAQSFIRAFNAPRAIVQDADVVMSQITRVMRFADPASIATRTGGFTCTVIGGRLPEFPANKKIGFWRTGNNLNMGIYANITDTTPQSTRALATNITGFTYPATSTTPYTFVITATEAVTGRSVTLKTSILPLP